MSVIVFSKKNCPNCSLTKRDMDILGIEYETINIDENKDAFDKIVSMGFKSAPVVEANGEYWSGYNQEKIKGLVSYV